MTRPRTDRDLLERTWQLYAEEFAPRVGEVVTPEDHVERDEAVEWGAQVFMFGYALGSVAGAHAAAPDAFTREAGSERVSAIVDAVTDIAADESSPVSSASVVEDFRRGEA